jgi:hypothetical protein
MIETDSQILGRLLGLQGARMSPERAQLLLSVRLPRADVRKIEQLGEKSSAGTLTPAEKRQYAAYVRAMDVLGILQSRARLVLKKLGKTG